MKNEFAESQDRLSGSKQANGNVAPRLNRRAFLSTLSSTLALSAAAALSHDYWLTRGAFAEEVARKTAWVEEGPFYPRRLPLDSDNDLLIVSDSITPAVGEITHLSGRLLDARGEPIKNAVIEIWQVDNNSVYLAERGRGANFDANFQGFGRFETGKAGEYSFRTIKPVPYQGRPAAHIHFKVKVKGQREWTTQLYIKNYPGNERDGVYSRIGNAADKETVTVDFVPVKESKIGELAARFDIVMGWMTQS
jgi:protocatechuate 3,4-dioxygenase beta subunit